MKNEQIIMAERLSLMDNGKIGTTGRSFLSVTGELLPEPEEIHTFSRWKAMGFSVKKGEKAIAKFPIWKYGVSKKQSEDGEEEKEKLFMKRSAFFAPSQVEPIRKEA